MTPLTDKQIDEMNQKVIEAYTSTSLLTGWKDRSRAIVRSYLPDKPQRSDLVPCARCDGKGSYAQLGISATSASSAITCMVCGGTGFNQIPTAKPELSERTKLLAMLKEWVSLYPDDGYDPIPIVRKARACITEVENRQK